uniref:PDZ domain-containing protein n=1 Tax=Lepisosteus oculatus TaxID=7918 RepID=W5NIU4_LEPOC
NGHKRNRSFSDNLVLEEAEEGGIVVADIKDDSLAAARGLKEGDEIVGATIFFDNLKKDDVVKLLKMTEPYNANMKVHTKHGQNAPGPVDVGYNKLFNSKIKKYLRPQQSLDGSLTLPGTRVNGINTRLNKKLKNTGTNVSLPNLSDPDVLNLQGPNLKGGIKDPASTYKWPSMNITSPNTQIQGPDLDIDAGMKTPKLNLSSPTFKGGINTPDSDINLPKADLKGPDLDFGPKVKGPDLDIDADMKTPDLNFSAPKIKGGFNTPDLDVSLPKADLKGPNVDLKSPNLDLKTPTLDIDAPRGKFKKSSLKMPDFGLSGPKTSNINGDFDMSFSNTQSHDVKLPKGNADLSTPGIEGPNVDMKRPKVDIPDIDLEVPGGTLKRPKFKLPSFGTSQKKPKGPDLDMDAKIKTPNIDKSAPKIKGSFGVPETDLDLKSPKLPGDIDLSAPQVQSNIKGPSFDVNKSQVKAGSQKATRSKPDLNMDTGDGIPNTDCSVPQVKGAISTPKLDMSSPKGDFAFNISDLDLDGPDSNLMSSSLKPSFTSPKMSHLDRDMDLNISPPKAGINATVPSLRGEITDPDLNVSLPNAPHIEAPHANVS